MANANDAGRSGFITAALRPNPEFKSKLKRFAQSMGYDTTDWVRVVMYQKCFEFIHNLGPSKLSVLEISGGNQWHPNFDFGSYEATQYPGFDVCSEASEKQYDLIIADQIFEHLEWPLAAAKNIHKMLKPGGYFINSAPFLIRVHASPIDCSRWTEHGFKNLHIEAGFKEELIQTDSWGNRACVKANLNKWAKRGMFGSLKNEPNFPVMVWAISQKEMT